MGIPLTKVANTSLTEQQAPPSSSFIMQQEGISSINAISAFVSSPSISTIVFIPHIASTMTVENKSQPSTKFSNKDKGKEEDIGLDEDIVIPNWDISLSNLIK